MDMGTVVEDTAMVMAVADMATVTDMVVEVMGMDMAAWPGLIRKIRADKSDFGKYMNSCLNKHSLGGR